MLNLNKSKFLTLVIATLLGNIFSPPIIFAAPSSIIDISALVRPGDATGFTATDIGNGSGECGLDWITSKTPNIDTQVLTIDGPQGPGIDLTSRDLLPSPGPYFVPSTPDNIVNYPPNTNITDLVIGWTYIFTLISQAGALQSTGVVTTCTPTSNLPKPNLHDEPDVTYGTSNTVYFDNNGVVDGVDAVNLTCNVRASLNNLALDPTAATVAESGWIDCKNPASTYSHIFTGLTIGNTYYYDVQSKDNDPDPLTNEGLSPYSDVDSSTQFAETGGGEEEEPPPAGGSGPPEEEKPACGDSHLDAGEECDDGNLIDGDGCNSFCEEEEMVTVIFDIKGRPQYRVPLNDSQNLSVSALFGFNLQGSQSVTEGQISLNNDGLATYQTEIPTGTYNFSLNGEAHLTKIIRGITIAPTTERVTLDFTLADTWELTAGDTVDNNVVNAVDMSKLIQQYRAQGYSLSDLNKEGNVNAVDASIVIGNFRKDGEYF